MGSLSAILRPRYPPDAGRGLQEKTLLVGQAALVVTCRGFPSADEDEVQAIARMIRYGASPGTVEALERMNTAIDVRDVLPLVSAPTLVVCQRGDPWVRVDHGRYLPSTSRVRRMWNWMAMTTFSPLPSRHSCWHT